MTSVPARLRYLPGLELEVWASVAIEAPSWLHDRVPKSRRSVVSHTSVSVALRLHTL